MPRVRLTESQRRADRFRLLFRVGKAKLDYTDEQIGELMGVNRTAVIRYRKNPEALYGKLISLGKSMGWTDEEWLSIIHAK